MATTREAFYRILSFFHKQQLDSDLDAELQSHLDLAIDENISHGMSPEEARHFIAGKYFAFTCFDGSRGSGRIMSDGSVAGTIQFGGQGPVRLAHLPVNTIRVGSTAVCASLKGIPFEPCFNVDKTDEVSFRGSVSGMGFAYCDFHKHGNAILDRTRHGRFVGDAGIDAFVLVGRQMFGEA